jgi:hypothetical protein
MSAHDLPSFKDYSSVQQVGRSDLEAKIGARGYDGGPYNSPFSQTGAVKEPFRSGGKFNPFMFMRPRRRRLNVMSIVLSMLIPIALFALTTWLFSFYVRDNYVIWGWFFVGCCSLLAICCIVKAAMVRQKQLGEVWTVPWYLRNDDDTWFMFLGAAVLVAVLLALLYGEYIYSSYTQSYYTYTELHTYKDLDPSQPGKAYLDAGAIEFKPDTFVDISQSLGYKDGHVYCVAPIKLGKDAVYNFDFWAVGIDCCNGFPGSFNCFERRNSMKVHGGLRVLDDSQAAFFKVGVMQATEEYQRGAPNPIFLTWMKDPLQEVRDLWRNGFRWYIGGVVVFALLEIGAVYAMAKIYWERRLWG